MLTRSQLETAWSTYRELHFAELAPTTRREYGSAVARALADLPWPCERADLIRWHRGLVNSRGYSITYANFILGTLQVVARRAAELTGDHALVAELAGARKMRAPVREPRCPPSDLLVRALEVARGPADRCWLLLVALAGLRRDELLGLKPDDWEAETRTLRVVRQRNNSQRKNRRAHAVHIDDAELAELLGELIAHPELAKPARGPSSKRGRGYVFPWSRRYPAELLERIREHLGAERDRYLPEGLGWHAFRHLGATELCRDGAGPVDVQAWLGDASPDVAMGYVAMVRGTTSSSVSRLAARLRGVRLPAKRVDKLARTGASTPVRAVTRSQVLADREGITPRRKEIPNDLPRRKPRRKRAN